MKKDLLMNGCGGLNDVRLYMRTPQAHTHIQTYGTAKETEQKLNKVFLLKASNNKAFRIF
jgi:hypothetical protein